MYLMSHQPSISSVYLITASLHTKILDFRGFDSSIILSLRGGVLTSIGSFLESLSRAILAGMILVGRLGVQRAIAEHFDTANGFFYSDSKWSTLER